MKTVIRIEHESGNGIWQARNEENRVIITNLKCYPEISNRHSSIPTPYEDDIYAFTESYFCSFKSIPQLEEWVEREWIKEFVSVGFRVYMLEISNWLEGNYQICFKKSDILSKKDITELFIK